VDVFWQMRIVALPKSDQCWEWATEVNINVHQPTPLDSLPTKDCYLLQNMQLDGNPNRVNLRIINIIGMTE
jgi:hypothetical protein